MKRRYLSDGEKRRLQRGDGGAVAEELAADEYDAFSRDFQDHPVHDLVGEGDDTVVQVKSTFEEIGDAYPAPGRFRVWKNQHEELLERDRDGTAWYAFVLYAPDGRRDVLARMVRLKPATVGRRIGARGGWNESGHEMGPQYKLPQEVVGL